MPSKKNVISFSLWGSNWEYVQGAIENIKLASIVYPGWICRIYHDDTVSKVAINILRDLGCEMVPMSRSEGTRGMMWRFSVAFDETVDRFIIRDTDSRLGDREKAAVDGWIASGKQYHIMRDHPHHGTEILGGMWGGTSGFVASFRSDYERFYNQANHVYGADQIFLKECVWPYVRNYHLAHDEFFSYTGNENRFPTPRAHGEFVGKPIRGDWV